MSEETIVLPGTLATAMVNFRSYTGQSEIGRLAGSGSAMFVSIIEVAIAVGSAVGGTVVDRAGTHADLALGLGLSLLGW